MSSQIMYQHLHAQIDARSTMPPTDEEPPSIADRTTLILLCTLPAVFLFALIMGIWHCLHKRRMQKHARRDEERGRTLWRGGKLAYDFGEVNTMGRTNEVAQLKAGVTVPAKAFQREKTRRVDAVQSQRVF